jgi:hypothetical protein
MKKIIRANAGHARLIEVETSFIEDLPSELPLSIGLTFKCENLKIKPTTSSISICMTRFGVTATAIARYVWFASAWRIEYIFNVSQDDEKIETYRFYVDEDSDFLTKEGVVFTRKDRDEFISQLCVDVADGTLNSALFFPTPKNSTEYKCH